MILKGKSVYRRHNDGIVQIIKRCPILRKVFSTREKRILWESLNATKLKIKQSLLIENYGFVNLIRCISKLVSHKKKIRI